MSNRIGPMSPLRLLHLPQRLLSAGLLAMTLPLAMAACAGPRAAAEMPSSAEQGAGVEPVAPGEPHPMPTPTRCNADAAKAAAIGQTADAATVERVRVQAGGHTVRVLKPGQAITKEYLDGRVNVHVDEKNVIVEVGCG